MNREKRAYVLSKSAEYAGLKATAYQIAADLLYEKVMAIGVDQVVLDTLWGEIHRLRCEYQSWSKQAYDQSYALWRMGGRTPSQIAKPI